MPDERARALCDAFRLEIRYVRPSDVAHCQVTVSTETLRAMDPVTFCAVPPAGDDREGNRPRASVTVTAAIQL
jgi:hypothetical protein